MSERVSERVSGTCSVEDMNVLLRCPNPLLDELIAVRKSSGDVKKNDFVSKCRQWQLENKMGKG